jgi:hypothetical protein
MGTVFARNSETKARGGVTAVTLFARRLSWHVRALGFNPLIRVTDRLEALAVLAVAITALIAIPTASQAGNLLYDSDVRTADQQAQSRHAVQAVVVEGTTRLPTDLEGSGFDDSAYVRAQWREGTEVRTEQVVSPETVKAGEPLTVWLDDTGKVVAAPLTKDDAEVNAVAAGGMVWIVVVVCSALAAIVIRRGLDRARDRTWERELRLLAHNDDGWANRHI